MATDGATTDDDDRRLGETPLTLHPELGEHHLTRIAPVVGVCHPTMVTRSQAVGSADESKDAAAASSASTR